MNKNNRGRPCKDVRRDNIISIRLSDDELNALNRLAGRLGTNRQEIIRACITDRYDSLYWPPKEDIDEFYDDYWHEDDDFDEY